MEYIKAVIEGKVKLSVELDKQSIVDLICSVNNAELYKDCLEGRTQLTFKLDSSIIQRFISKIDENDPNHSYAKDVIEGRVQLAYNPPKKYMVDSLIKELIEHIDREDQEHLYIKAIVEGKVQTSTELHENYMVKFIKIIDGNDDEHTYMRELIKTGHIGNLYVLNDLLKIIDDVEFTKKCINENSDFLFLLSPYQVGKIGDPIIAEKYLRQIEAKNSNAIMGLFGDLTRLIKSIDNPEFIKDCIEGRIEVVSKNSRNIEWWSIDICELIKKINDEEYTKLCISGKIPLIRQMDDVAKCELIISTNDLQYICECIKNRNELGINVNDLIEKSIDLPNIEQYAEEWLENWQELSLNGEELCSLIKITDTDLAQQINFDRLEEILSMQDADYIKGYLLDNVILNNMGQQGANIEAINAEIEKIHEIFLTSTLPDNFKMFQFFKYHKNHDSSNTNLYNEIDTEERDKIISGDLFRVSLESGNIKMRSFLELLRNGNIALSQENTNDELGQAILLEYRDILYSLSDATVGIHLMKTQDYIQDLSRIREFLNLNNGEDIGEALLNRYFEGTGLDYRIEGQNLVDTLLNVMESKTKEAHNNNQRPFSLSQGDLIKGTEIKYLEDFLSNGIRAKEFLMKGSVNSDATPLDTDFSEISEQNLQRGSLFSILNSTYTGNSYGNTYLVIKRKNYEGDEVGYTGGTGAGKTRYFRTGMGSTNISAIITSEWNEEYKYVLARNGAYIPVINKDDGRVLFTIKEYESIRQQMQGLSHFGISEYTLDATAYDADVKKQAEELRRSAEGKASTEEKRKAVMDFIRKHIGREITTEMLGDVSSRYLELIDTGSTGRGTNIPGDGDFDFMLKCSSRQEQEEMIAKIKTFLAGKDKGGTGPYAIRYVDVKVDGVDEPVEVDVTAEKKRLEVDYSSDLAVRDRLGSIRRQYGEDGLRTVVDNIIVAKKVLKEKGIYKRVGSTGATELGGFGGIGVENWILQNGGSFTKAMQTFLEHTIDENGKEVSFSEFQRRYPIYDFGQNHRFETGKHDHFIKGLSEKGFEQMKEFFREQLKERETTIDTTDSLGDSIIQFATRAEGYTFSDMSQIYSLVARLKTHEQSREQQESRGEK